MRRVAVLVGLAVLGGCQGNAVKRALAEERSEIAACRTTYPPGTGHFGAYVRCEMGSGATCVQQTDTSELRRLTPVTDDIAHAADEVDAGRSTMQAWRAHVRARIDALPAADNRTKQGLQAAL